MRRVRTIAGIIFTFIAAAFLYAALTVLPDRLAFDGGDNYCFFVGDTSKDCRTVNCDAKDAGLTRLTLTKVCGESATFSALDIDGFLNKVNGEIIFTEELSDSVNYYCRANLPYSINLYGEEINLHICVKQEGVTVASPIIFGGY